MAVVRSSTPPLSSGRQQWRDEFTDSLVSQATRLTYDRIVKFDVCGDPARFEIRKVHPDRSGQEFGLEQTDLQWYIFMSIMSPKPEKQYTIIYLSFPFFFSGGPTSQNLKQLRRPGRGKSSYG